MPRHHRRRPDATAAAEGADAAPGHERVEDWNGEEWYVRSLPGAGSTKAYRCPGCDHEVRPGTPHVVAWPAELPIGSALDAGGSAGSGGSAIGQRRHWHTACWNARASRRPRLRRR